jgi:hypothetical protein
MGAAVVATVTAVAAAGEMVGAAVAAVVARRRYWPQHTHGCWGCYMK